MDGPVAWTAGGWATEVRPRRDEPPHPNPLPRSGGEGARGSRLLNFSPHDIERGRGLKGRVTMLRLRHRFVAAGAMMVLALLGWLCWLQVRPKVPRTQLAAPPKFTFSTGHVTTSGWGGRNAASVEDISDDGRRVIVGKNFYSKNAHVISEFEVWDTAAGQNVTPTHWNDPDWKKLITDPLYARLGLKHVFLMPEGRNFARDGEAWSALRDRLAKQRQVAIESGRRKNPLAPDYKGRIPFPREISFRPDGQFISYVVSDGLALEFVDQYEGDGTVVEDVPTGKRVATLAGVTQRVVVAPGGRTAVSLNHPVEGDDEGPRLVLWDLESSRRRAGLLVADYSRPCPVHFTPDGQYVFFFYYPWRSNDHFSRIRWWD